jgi:hypothetical protein
MDAEGAIVAERLSECLRALERESDRGAVVLGAAVLHVALHDLLVARMVEAPEREDKLLDGFNAPCRSFAAQINLAYRIGAIRAHMRHTLHLIREMRNDAAHLDRPCDFSSPELRDRLRTLFKLNADTLGVLREGLEAIVKRWGKPAPPGEIFGPMEGLEPRYGWDLFVSLIASVFAVERQSMPRIRSGDQPPGGSAGSAPSPGE